MKIEKLSKDDFIKRNNIEEGVIERCKISWEAIKEIGIDHQKRTNELKETAELFAKIIQRSEDVHSVRWRVKDPEHLMEKLARKTDPESESYNSLYDSISVENYYTVITDLVGVRAIHLFKDDFIKIDSYVRDKWKIKEDKPIIYIRKGDDLDELSPFNDVFDIKEHPAGYRSVHYVFETMPLKRPVYVEVQVRTIFEEGWSEIDHKVRYPNFSDNELINYFLKIFNRMAGSSDEMGSFVKNLANGINSYSNEIHKLKGERDNSINEIENLLAKLDNVNGKNANNKKTIADLKAQVNKMKDKSSSVIDLEDTFNNDLSRSILKFSQKYGKGQSTFIYDDETKTLKINPSK